MKQISGQPFNITTEILGRITLQRKNVFNRKDAILVKKDIDSCPSGYSAVISNSHSQKTTNPYVCCTFEDEDFHEGDVVLINKEGEIVFLYERQSPHNAIFVTERCNHRCIMCPQPPVVHEEDKTFFNMKLISLIDKDTLDIGITGGEPTLIGDKLFEIIHQIKKYQPNASISLLSNGVKFADKGYAMKLAMCNCRDLQVDVPIFSDNAEEHNRIVGANTFYKTVQGLYNLALFHVQIGLRIVVHRQTYKRLPQLADYIYRNFPFVSQVAFLQMETTGMADKNLDELWIDPYEYNEELKQAVLLLENRGICAKIYNAQLCVLPKEIQEYAYNSISDWKDTFLPECEGCKLKEKCGGLFESNRLHHSKHIKPDIKFTPMPAPKGDMKDAVSPFLIEEALTDKVLSQYVNPIIYDVPVGYGRHLLWLASKGYEVHGLDLDTKALQYLDKRIEEDGLLNAYTRCADIEDLPAKQCCDIMINIHLYSRTILEKLTSLVKTGGLFIMETPSLYGENYLTLPAVGEVKSFLEKDFELVEYRECNPQNGKVAVKVIARRKSHS